MHAATMPHTLRLHARVQPALLPWQEGRVPRSPSLLRRPGRTLAASAPPQADPSTSASILESLHAERVAALAAATLNTRRGDRLAPKLASLEAEALAAVKGGDERAARAALERKRAVTAAVEACRRRSLASASLAAALAVKMERLRRGQ